MASEQELADLEKLSSEYAPDIKGPFIGPRQSTEVLVAEYAEADPVYVHKTIALPAKFSHYRTVKGDGNCGWRALAFGYFETLLRLNEPTKYQRELDRLRACNAMLDATGFSSAVYEDFADETFSLLEELAAGLPNTGGASLYAKFNDEATLTSSAITYHFRLLTSAWMKSYPDVYAPFLDGMDVDTYCQRNILPSEVELDHVGLQCLAHSVINEAGFSIEVLYLDRSEGEEVNTHTFPVLNAMCHVVEGTPTIRLLYRPGHYDLLYKSEDIISEAASTIDALSGSFNPEVRRVAEPAYQFADTFSQPDELGAYMAEIPFFTQVIPASTFSTSLYQSPSLSAPLQSLPSPTGGIGSQLAGTSLDATIMESNPHSDQSSSPSPSDRMSSNPIRYGNEQLDYNRRHANLRLQQAQAGVTVDNPDMTKKENPAHFTNDAFQPEIWRSSSTKDGKGSS